MWILKMEIKNLNNNGYMKKEKIDSFFLYTMYCKM